MQLLISTAHGRGAGAETMLAELLHATVPGFREHVLLAAPMGSYVWTAAQESGVRAVAWPTTKCTLLQNLLATSRIHLPSGIDGIHAWHSRNYEIGLLLGRRLHIPVTTTVHDHPWESRHRWSRRFLARYCLDHFSTAVCVSECLRDACEKQRIKSPLLVIKNGIRDFRLPHTSASRVRIGFLGMSTPMKGFSIVRGWLNALPPDCEWHLYGDVCPRFALEVEALNRPGGRRVQYHGTKTVQEIFGQIDVLVHASQQFDPYPTVLLEAACAGIPSVASCLGGAPEIVLDGRTGFLFDPSNPETGLAHLRQLTADEEQRRCLGAAARERFESEFRLNRMAQQYRDLWSHMMPHNRHR
jgi:glycosyltransferase involved in cell wall biosynthesis